MTRPRPISESLKINEANEKYSLPNGQFLVIKDFRISPGGGWAISFKKGQLIEYNDKTKECVRYSTTNPDGKVVAPPISGETQLDISAYGRYPEQEEMLAAFQQGTKAISKKEFDKLKAELGSAIDSVIASLKNYSQDQLKTLRAELDKLIKK